MDAVAGRVLGQYPSPLRGAPEALGNRGGFSGARLWRLHTAAGLLCLRAGAPQETREQLVARHRLMRLAREAGLAFIPRVLETMSGDTGVEASGRVWELMEWMPGRADYRELPSGGKLETAARSLARVHLAWAVLGGEEVSPCPAVRRRLLVAEGFPSGRLESASWKLAATVSRWLPRVPQMLLTANVTSRIQPCLRDVWHDHLLYEGEQLTGLIDYAAVGPDSVAVDVARMVGSLVGDDEEGWRVALSAYREVRTFSHQEEQLARVLDRTGVIVGLANWLRWLGEPGREFEESAHVTQRIEELLARVARWNFHL